MSTKPKGMLFDMNLCGGCSRCVGACMKRHDFPGKPEEVRSLSATACTMLVQDGDNFARNLCRHCVEPSCASVCPVGALEKTAEGPVVYDAGSAWAAATAWWPAPSSVPRYEWNEAVPAVRKCDLCFERLQAKGKPPACAEACPAGATIFGTREEMLAEAHRRIAESPDLLPDHVYGETRSAAPRSCSSVRAPSTELGLPRSGSAPSRCPLTWRVLQQIPGVVGDGRRRPLGALWWITQRREEVARVAGEGVPGRAAGRRSTRARSHGHEVLERLPPALLAGASSTCSSPRHRC